MPRHLRLHEFADYNPSDIHWVMERLKPYAWALKFEDGRYTCTAWTKDASLTNYRTAIAYSPDSASYAMAEAYDQLMDFLDEPNEDKE